MTHGTSPLRNDAIAIWRAGVDAVDSERLVRGSVRWTGDSLTICRHRFELSPTASILVVGAGKAGAGMAAGFEEALAGSPAAARLSGWVNVPADCVRPLERIHLHAARPAGVNEPTETGVAGSREILRRVHALSPDDLCIALLSGGGSALLPAPIPGITLADKQAVTRLLMSAGATINELNCVRKHLSEIKGGKLARAAARTRLVALIISDVIGDPLDVIASGPAVADRSSPTEALAVLEKYAGSREAIPRSVWSVLMEQSRQPPEPPIPDTVWNLVIGNNATALEGAAKTAAQLGYTVRSLGSANGGIAADVGRELAELARSIRDSEPSAAPVCVLSGGEPIVALPMEGTGDRWVSRDAKRSEETGNWEAGSRDPPRKGGRNQELVLAAAETLWDDGMDRIAVLSGGTDGEDGPTDAAGAIADADVLQAAVKLGLNPSPYLAAHNSYAFFEPIGALLKTGPTHTNVADVRVVLIAPAAGGPVS